MATGERQFVLTDSIEDCLAHPNSLVIVNASEPFAAVGTNVSALIQNGHTVLLYGERAENTLLYHTFRDCNLVSCAICMEEAEYTPCCDALKRGDRYISIAVGKCLKRQPLAHEKTFSSLTNMQTRVLFSLLSGKTVNDVADEENTTADSIRHMKGYLKRVIETSFGGTMPIESASWLFS